MAKVTIYWTSGKVTSFETTDEDTIRRYQNYALTDPKISSVNVKN